MLGPDGYPTARSFCQAIPNDVGSFYQTWPNDVGPCCLPTLSPDGSPVVGSFCQDPTLLGLTLPPNPMTVGLSAQQEAPAAVGPGEAKPTKVGLCFYQDLAVVDPELRAEPTTIGPCFQPQLPIGLKRIESWRRTY